MAHATPAGGTSSRSSLQRREDSGVITVRAYFPALFGGEILKAAEIVDATAPATRPLHSGSCLRTGITARLGRHPLPRATRPTKSRRSDLPPEHGRPVPNGSCAPRGVEVEEERSQAGLAQLVEHELPKLGVAGSNPVSRSSSGG